MTAVPPIKALSNGAKVAGLSGGMATGLALGVSSEHLLVSASGERALEKEGTSAMSGLELRATVAPLMMFGAAAIGAGIGKRSGSAALTTASLGAAAMLASPASGAMENAESLGVDTNLSRMGVLGSIASAGFAVGAMERFNLNRVKVGGLATMGFAAGMLMLDTGRYVAGIPGDIGRGFEHRDK